MTCKQKIIVLALKRPDSWRRCISFRQVHVQQCQVEERSPAQWWGHLLLLLPKWWFTLLWSVEIWIKRILAPSWCVEQSYEADIPALSSWWSPQVNHIQWCGEQSSLQEQKRADSCWWCYGWAGLTVPSTGIVGGVGGQGKVWRKIVIQIFHKK